jgi:hypothetical protein
MVGQNTNQIGMMEVEKHEHQYFAHKQNKTEVSTWKKFQIVSIQKGFGILDIKKPPLRPVCVPVIERRFLL